MLRKKSEPINQTAKKITVFIRTSPFQKDKESLCTSAKDIDLPIRTNDSIAVSKSKL